MLTKLAIWYLRKRKKSVIIGFIANGGWVQPKNNHPLTYECDFFNTKFVNKNGTTTTMPYGKFNFESGMKENN